MRRQQSFVVEDEELALVFSPVSPPGRSRQGCQLAAALWSCLGEAMDPLPVSFLFLSTGSCSWSLLQKHNLGLPLVVC